MGPGGCRCAHEPASTIVSQRPGDEAGTAGGYQSGAGDATATAIATSGSAAADGQPGYAGEQGGDSPHRRCHQLGREQGRGRSRYVSTQGEVSSGTTWA